jgi:adenine-specific DNA-methyltransferase
MADRKTRLELTWIGKENRPRLEPRILLEVPELSYSAKQRVTEHDLFDNMLIQGDNLLALKALEQRFAGKIRCIYIDPPYNTGAAFEQYDDGIEHSLWLSLIRDRLQLIRSLLRPDGSVWISIDDNECHYLKVLCDEVFGRSNFVANIVWEKRTTRENRRVFSFNHDHILVVAKDKTRFDSSRNSLPLDANVLGRYKNPDNDPRGPWQSVSANAQAGHATASQFYELVAPSGVVHHPPEGRCWLYTKIRMDAEILAGNIWFGKDGRGAPRIKKFLSTDDGGVTAGLTPETLWRASDVETNDLAKKHILSIFAGELRFDTPKPEALIARIMQIASDPNDWVLDSFLGSGTTASVAQKLGRRWIGIELGEHAVACCAPRLRKVIDGDDQGGVTQAANWTGGGGFRFYRLAPSLLEKDKWNNWVINRTYNKEMLAEALCKLNGFTYAPSETVFWMHGQSTERDYLYVTTQTLSFEQLRAISEDVGPERSLLICCGAWIGDLSALPNLTIAKIPQSVLERCEWGKDDYSLNVANLTGQPPEPPPTPPKAKPSKAKTPPTGPTLPLFSTRGDE